MALTVQSGALRLEGNALGTGEACCCGGGGQCCCVGTSAVSYDENLEPTGEPCQNIETLDPEESCDGQQVSQPETAKSCEDVTIVVEWCDLTATLESPNFADEDVITAPNFPFPPGFCVADGAEVTRHSLWAASSGAVGNPPTADFSDCDFGCFVGCNRLLLRFGVLVDETPFIGAARSRLFYVTLREGCDDSPVIETVYDQGAYCCPDDPEITITIAP